MTSFTFDVFNVWLLTITHDWHHLPIAIIITNFPFLSSNIPTSSAYGVLILQLIRYVWACSSYGCFILRATRLWNKLPRTGIRQGTLEIVIEEVLWSIRRSYQTIWSFPLTNVKWHSVTWPYTMTTPYWSGFVPISTFYIILSGFHRTFATGVACRQGTLTPPNTLSRPFGTCICSTCWDQSFSELVVILPDYALRISLGTFSILLSKISASTCCNCYLTEFGNTIEFT